MLMTPRTAFLILAFCAATTFADRLHIAPFSPAAAHSAFVTDATKLHQPASFGGADARSTAVAFAKTQFKLKEGDFVVKNVVPTQHNGLTHVYLRQVLKGQEVANADMNINVDKSGKILSYGSSFLPMTQDVLTKSKTWDGTSNHFVSPTDAFKTLARFLKQSVPANVKAVQAKTDSVHPGHPSFTLSNIPFAQKDVQAEQAYIQTADGAVQPTWRMNLNMGTNWYDAHVAADGSTVVALYDWVKDATFKAIKIGDVDPNTPGFSVLKDPANVKSSPHGWNDDGTTKTTTTTGNNVWAQENWEGADNYLNNHRPDAGAKLDFEFAFDKTQDPKTYIDAAVANLFYWNNVMHDVSYQYGFDEAAGNFQQTNFGGAGAGGDYVIANAQDGSGTDNANFATPPDGQHGVMRMYVFDTMTPNVDGDFETDIVSHEYTHGISNRLTGGPANTDCLNDGESGGMGEGWSDYFALTLQMKESYGPDHDVGLGFYVVGKTIRNYMYSTNIDTNPTSYGWLNDPNWQEVHAIGEIWCNTLIEMYHNVVGAVGKFNPDWYSADKTSGNTLALQIVVDGLKLQPCNPTFITARDAILQAEKVATGGKYQCDVWKAFAKRGVGAKATSDSSVAKPKKNAVGTPASGPKIQAFNEDFTLPEECGGGEVPNHPPPHTVAPVDPPAPTTPVPTTPTTPAPTTPAPTTPTTPAPTTPAPTTPAPTTPAPTKPAPTKPAQVPGNPKSQ